MHAVVVSQIPAGVMPVAQLSERCRYVNAIRTIKGAMCCGGYRKRTIMLCVESGAMSGTDAPGFRSIPPGHCLERHDRLSAIHDGWMPVSWRRRSVRSRDGALRPSKSLVSSSIPLSLSFNNECTDLDGHRWVCSCQQFDRP